MMATDTVPSPPGTPGFRAGRFVYYIDGDRWEWSDELAQIHGYESADVVTPTTELLLRHKHPDDRARVADLINRVRFAREPFSGTHRIVDAHGVVVPVIVVADSLIDAGSTDVVGTSGYYIALDGSQVPSELLAMADDELTQAMRDHVDEVLRHRMMIEQAKGVIRFVYQLDDQQAFDLLVWRSQETNTKIRDLAENLCDRLTTIAPSSDIRARFDHLLLTAHEGGADAEE